MRPVETKKNDSTENDEKKMGFFDHIDELRVRFLRMIWVFLIGFAVSYLISEPLMEWLKAPLFKVLPPESRSLYFTNLFENFLTHLKISAYAAIFFLSPYFFYEVWKFVAPGLKEKEKKLVLPFVFGATFFFIAGALFAYYVLFPVGFKFFVTYGSSTDVPLLTIDSYYSTALKLMLLFGLGFELPVFITLLGALGVIDSSLLKKHRRSAILGITVLSAMFAPPDAVSMLILMGPLILMYEGSIHIVHWIGAKRQSSELAQNIEEREEKDPWVGKSDY